MNEAPGISVDIQYVDPGEACPDEGQIDTWTRAALAGRREAAELTVRIVGEAEGLELNRHWRGGDRATNVLSFPFEAPPGIRSDLLGDVVICAPVAAREALQADRDVTAHWAHLVVHGVLHLLGYDHESDDEAQLMERLEVEIMQQLGFADPYGEPLQHE